MPICSLRCYSAWFTSRSCEEVFQPPFAKASAWHHAIALRATAAGVPERIRTSDPKIRNLEFYHISKSLCFYLVIYSIDLSRFYAYLVLFRIAKFSLRCYLYAT